MAKRTISWPLASAPESKDHLTLRSEYDLFIGCKWVKPKSGYYFDTIISSFVPRPTLQR